MDIVDKRVLITGASSGIGKEAALLFASKGSKLLLAARREPLLTELAGILRSRYSCDAGILPLDASDLARSRAALEQYMAEHAIDIAVINHGIGQYGRFANSPWSALEPVLRTNIDGAVNIAHTVLPSMIARRRGSIIFVTSILGKRAIPNNAVYCASKFALHGLADALRLEVKRHGIHIGTVAPSRTDTPFFESMAYTERQGKPAYRKSSHPSLVARQIVRCATDEKREIIFSLPGKVFAAAGQHFPRLSDWMLGRSVPEPVGAADE